MKKTLRTLSVLLLTLTLVFALTACGNGGNTDSSEAVPGETTEYGDNAIAEILNQGYMITQSTWDETTWKGILKQEDSWDVVYLAEAKMTAELYEKFESISYEDEQCDEKRTAFVTYLDGATVTDISDEIPTQEELDKLYIGKTIGELEEEGFENSGYTSDPDTLETAFFYDGPEYCVRVAPKKGTKVDMEDMSNNDIRKLVIASVEFQGISGHILD